MNNHQRHIAILGGSFNPVHIGHLMLAQYVVEFTDVDQVWLMLSPLNPLKDAHDMAPDADRLAMLHLATCLTPSIRPCDIELTMPRPSYSIDSLSRLAELYPDCRFSLLIGSDNWLVFDRWREHQLIIERFAPIIYPRPGYSVDPASLPEGVTLIDAPHIDVSSTFLRDAIASARNVDQFMPAGVYDYITQHSLYSNEQH